MPFEMTVGLWVNDQANYTRYRDAIAPLLEATSARFRYDFEVSRTLRSETGTEINRLFLLSFLGAHEKDAFFANEEYRAIRRTYFEPSVGAIIILSQGETPGGAG